MTDTVTIRRELLERVAKPVETQYDRDQRWIALEELRAALAAPVQGEASQETAQPEVAENTGSLDTTKTPIGVEAVSLSVDGVAAPDEAEKVDDIFAWATFDGEGSYDLRLYEDNETYLADWLRVQGQRYAKWVFPLYTTPPQPADVGELEHANRLLRYVRQSPGMMANCPADLEVMLDGYLAKLDGQHLVRVIHRNQQQEK